jgi:hypothetical protein
MQLDLLTKEELLTAAIATKRPVAFLVGSPLSLKDGQGVPGIVEILDIVKEEIRSRAAFALPRFNAELAGKTGGEAYQVAMKWLGRNAGQDAINDVIKAAVLRARKDGTSNLSAGTDGEPIDWHIPVGTIGLANLVARGGEKFLGPILTTNFDPLVSLAIRMAGGRAGRRVLTADGSLAGAAEDEIGICSVVHLHGFWRESDTLHTQAQLTNHRPRLTKSLQRLLQRRTLIVAAYGGWDDTFTQALIDLMNDEQAPLDVIWCFYGSDAINVTQNHSKLLASVESAIVMNRFRAFGGIDCHTIFDEILSTLQGTVHHVSTPSVESPIAGWDIIDCTYLGGLQPLRPEEVVRFFDGATPTWRHATCMDIQRRIGVAEVVRRLTDAKSTKTSCSLQLIRAAGGEGKSTLLLQIGAAAAESGEWNVLWRPVTRVGLPPEHIAKLDSAKHWLIIADDAENLVRDLAEAARLLHEAGQSHVHFLFAARDADWRYFGGDQQSWGTLIKRHSDILLRGLNDADAKMLVAAWQKYGEEGLRGLASAPNTDQQVAKLLEAVQGATSTRDDGSFFGGLLAVRFGPEGLRNHVDALLSRLREAQIKNSSRNLFDAILFVAACHGVGIPGIDERVLADLLGVEHDWVQTLVVNPLGEEAAAVRSAGHVMTRHSNVAAAILVASEQGFGIDIAEVWSAIVRQTVRTSKEGGVSRQTHSRIVHAGPQLQRTLPRQLTEQRRKEIAVAAAMADIDAEPDRLCALVDLGKTYRNARDLPAAIQVFRQNLYGLSRCIDYDSVVRGYWYEWGVSEGSLNQDLQQGTAAGWLQGLSLADHLKPAPITAERAKISLAGLGIAFGKIAEPRPNCPFACARRASCYLGRLTNPDPKTLGYFNQHDLDADKIHTPHPKNIDEAIGWLEIAVVQAGRELHDSFLKALLKPEQVSFKMLGDFFRPAPTPPKRPSRYVPTTALQGRPIPEGMESLLQLSNELEERFNKGIERVLTQAWGAVPIATPEEDRFGIAKLKAGGIIARLSPSIRKRVAAHFNADKWESLKLRDPLL